MNSESSDETAPARFIVGIDLGTTNCALAYADTQADAGGAGLRIELFRIEQWVDLGQLEAQETLPSFHYEWTTSESVAGYRLPWQSDPPGYCVGVLARDAGERQPGRRAASAKSWLSHDGVDRTADLLPWHGDADVRPLSPVEASARYLRHLKEAWNHAHPQDHLEDQDVVITLPASFDEVARELTVAAAKKAGLRRVYLIEEPQAAFYAWIDRQGERWADRVKPGQLILVCDIGGGTTDLTLIRVRASDSGDDRVQFHRVAVGEHLILGGDNLDLAVAKLAESKLGDVALSPTRWDRLVQASRSVKEAMLGEDRPDTMTIHLPGEGSRLVGGGLRVELTADEIDAVLLDGFFPQVELTDRAARGGGGFQEFGLPYATDPAVTRHLAEFLHTHRRTGLEAGEIATDRPDWVLFNGGVMAAPAIQTRIVDSLTRWFSGADDWTPEVLRSPRLDLAVARGAAYYGLVRRGEGVRIAANLGHAYYVQVDTDPPRGLCVIPGRAEAGQAFEIADHPLRLKVGSPAQFALWVSSTRLADAPGELIAIDRAETSPLPPICTALMQRRGRGRGEGEIDVVIESELSEIGTVGIYCVEAESRRRWRLDFDIRSTLETDREAHRGGGEAAGIIDDETVGLCESAIAAVFGDRVSDDRSPEKPGRLVKRLQSITETRRNRWPPSLLRQLWQILIDHEPGRRQSPQHESRWLNLVGFCLRPGYGVAVDDYRVSTTWKTLHGRLAFASAATRTESMILWRRIAGGLTAGQQTQLAAPWLGGLIAGKLRPEPHEAGELWRLAGSLERISAAEKIRLGRAAIESLGKKRYASIRDVLAWSVGRLGARRPVYGPLNSTVPVAEAASWCEALIDAEVPSSLPLVQLTRLTGDRFRDVPAELRSRVLDRLREQSVAPEVARLVTEVGEFESETAATVFGDSLPLGIRLQR